MIKKLMEKRSALLKKVDDLTKQCETENRAFTPEENKTVTETLAEIRSLKEQIEQLEAVNEQRNAQTAIETRAAAAPAPAALSGAPVVQIGRSSEQRDLAQFSLTRAFNSLLEGRSLEGVEREMHQEGVRELRDSGAGGNGGNLVMPSIIMHQPYQTERRDMTATGGSSGSQGGVNVQTNVQGIVERLRANLGIVGMGARVMGNLRGDLSFPIFAADDQAAIKAETAAANESSPTFTAKTMRPNRVPVFLDVSRQLLMQSENSGLEGFLRDDLAYQVAKLMETKFINGSGSSEPYGILNTVGVGSVAGGTNGLAPTWQHILDLESAVANVDAQVGNLGYYTNTKVRGKLKATSKVSGQNGFIWEDNSATPLNGHRVGVSTLVPSDLTKGTSSGVCSAIIYGNFADAMIGQWGGLEFLVDPYSLGTQGLIRINCWTFFDFLVRRPASFAVMKDALTT